MNDELTPGEMTDLEENVQFVSYKRTISVYYQSITREMSVGKPEHITLEKCNNYVRNQVNYQLQRDVYMLKNNKFNMQGYRGG